MQKISSYLYSNRIQLLADLANFTVEYTNVYQRIVKIYNGIDNVLEFDIKNADQKRIDLDAFSSFSLNVMDQAGNALPNSPYTVTPLDQTTHKGIAKVTIPKDDLVTFRPQFFTYSVTGVSGTSDVILYADTRFGALGKLELVGNAVPVDQGQKVGTYDSFTAEIDLKGVPTYHSSAIPAKYYEAVPSTSFDFAVDLVGFTGSIWIETSNKSTINLEAFKNSEFIRSETFTDYTGTWTPTTIDATDKGYQYFRVSYTTPYSNGIGASFLVTLNEGAYNVTVRAGGTGYSINSKIKVLGSLIGGTDGINDLIITATSIDGSSHLVPNGPSSYTTSSISAVSWEGTAVSGSSTFVVTGTNITGNVDKITVTRA